MGNICTKCHRLKPDNPSHHCRACITRAVKPARVPVDFATRNKAIAAAWLSGKTRAELASAYSLKVWRIGAIINAVLASDVDLEHYFTTGVGGSRTAQDARHGAEGTNIKGEAK